MNASFLELCPVCAVFPVVTAGVGNFTQTLVMVILMAAFQQTATVGLSPHRLEIVWRLQYAFIAVVLLVLSIYRCIHLKESELWKSVAPLRVLDSGVGGGGSTPFPATSTPIDSGIASYPSSMQNDDSLRVSVPASDSIAYSDSSPGAALATPGSWRDSKSMQFISLFLRTNWHRLIGASVGWFVWDVAFYGTYFVHHIAHWHAAMAR